MAGLFGLSVDRENLDQEKFGEDLFLGTFYHQHLGEDCCGVATVDREGVFRNWPPQEGLFRSNFEKKRGSFVGINGIGYCGSALEPLFVDSKIGPFSICFSGNIINRKALRAKLMNSGQVFGKRPGDIEIISRLIVQGDNIFAGIKKMNQMVKGAFSLLILLENGLCVVRSSNGHWPLVLGMKEGVMAVASESGGFRNLGFKLIRDIIPGEILFLSNGNFGFREYLPEGKKQICSFTWIYTAFPNGVFNGIPASLVRKRLGAILARRDVEKGFIPDRVSYVPYSGGHHGIGYHNELCRQRDSEKIDRIPPFDEVLFKYAYAGRSYTSQDKTKRKREAFIKLLAGGEDYSGQKVVICDDSIVRGTQTSENLVPKLESMGFKEVHFRISNPELRSHCHAGKTTKPGELFATNIPLKQERIDFLNSKSKIKIVKSLEYNMVEDLKEAIGLSLDELCVDCDLDPKQ